MEEFDKLQEDWLPYEVEQEKQTSDKEYIARYSILTLSREFYDEATSEPQEKERLDFIFNVFQKKISHSYEKKTIESLFNYYKTDFISQLEKSDEFVDEQERAESIEVFKQKVEPYFTKIFKKLEKQLHKIQNTQHNENMSNDDMQTLLDKYLLDEDYANASLMRDKMKEKGYAPKS